MITIIKYLNKKFQLFEGSWGEVEYIRAYNNTPTSTNNFLRYYNFYHKVLKCAQILRFFYTF